MHELIVKQTGKPEVGKVYIGNTHTPIQQALDYLKNNGGGSVEIHPGIYMIGTPIAVPSNVRISGFGKSTKLEPTFGNSGEIGVLQHIGTDTNRGEGITIEDLFVGKENAGTSRVGRYGIYFSFVGNNSEGNKKSIIRNCYVEGNNGVGIYLNNSSNHTITGNTTNSNTSHGILLTNSSNNTITGNTASSNNNTGIYLNSSSNNTITGNTASNNTNSNGIYLSNSNNNTITGNTTNNNTNGIQLYSSSNNNIITGNTANNNSHGIFLNSSGYITVTGNTANNNNIGILLSNSSNNNTITGNTANNNAQGIGIVLNSSSTKNTITGNTVRNNTSYGGSGNITIPNLINV